jgi:hypothetical protein
MKIKHLIYKPVTSELVNGDTNSPIGHEDDPDIGIVRWDFLSIIVPDEETANDVGNNIPLPRCIAAESCGEVTIEIRDGCC